MGKQSNTKNIIAKKATKSKASTKKISNSSKKTIVSSKAKPVSKTSKTSKSKNSGSTKAKVKSKKQKQKKNKKKGNSSDNEKALTKLNLQQLEELHKKEYWRHSKKLNWDGYSDEAGSVASGILEESICFDCGELTTLCDDWSKLVLCDGCEGEYHLECVNLDLAPRKRFICPRCVQDTREFEGINYNIKGFPIPKDKKKKRIICYSPSRPLYLAWEECVEKGFMVVSKVFSYEIMKTLTHGKVEQVSSFGRVSDKWVGIINEMESYTPNSSIRHITMRGDRYDIKLPDFLVKHLKLDELLQPILEKLRTIMGFPKPILRTHNIVFVPVGSQPQTWHNDDSLHKSKFHRFFTILINLNILDSECGGTEVWYSKERLADLIRPRPGDAFVFNGTLNHRGQGNFGGTHRYFYYASFACKSDANAVELI